MEWLTRPDLEDETPNIDRIISVFIGTKKDGGNPYPSIKSWAQPVGVLKDLLNNILKIKGALVFCTYHWLDGLK